MPRFARRDAVVVSLLDEAGKPRKELPATVLQYHDQHADVVGYYLIKGDTVYSLRMADGTVLQLTEDCLAQPGGPA